MSTEKEQHALIFDGTTYYVVSFFEAQEIQKKDKDIEIIKTGNSLDDLSDLADELNDTL